MSTTAGIQAALDTTSSGLLIRILNEQAGATVTQYYAVGGITAPGKARWTQVTNASSDATNAAAITTNLQL